MTQLQRIVKTMIVKLHLGWGASCANYDEGSVSQTPPDLF